MTDDQVREIQAAIFAGNKIEAIKLYRGITGQGLKESKDFVEALELELRIESPELFAEPAGGMGCGPAAAAVLAVAAIVAVASVVLSALM